MDRVHYNGVPAGSADYNLRWRTLAPPGIRSLRGLVRCGSAFSQEAYGPPFTEELASGRHLR